MSGEKTTNVNINTGGGSLTIGGDAQVGSILDSSATVGSHNNARADYDAEAIAVDPFDVFISYAHTDREHASRLAAALEARGLSVWFDRELLAGDQFVRHINARLNAARWVIVIWSAAAIDSEWVLNEAEMARRRGVLLSVSTDGSSPPAPFTLMHAPQIAGPDANTVIEQLMTRVSGA